MGDRDLYHLLPASAQILTNADLLHGIFTFIPRSSPLRHSYLLGCTTVCRTFHAPAIRVLWRTLETLVTLWHLLAPSNVAYPFGYTYSGGRDKILLDYLHEVNSARLYLDPIRWDRFLWHAAHVRDVFHFATSPALCDATRLLIQGVVMQNDGNPILPLLRAIRWWTRVPVRDGAFIPLLTSTLRHANICFARSDEPAFALLLRRLHEAAPFLEMLSIHMGPELDSLGLSLIEELISFDRLRDVRITKIRDISAFQAIVTKANLTSLDVVARCGNTGSWVGFASRAVSVFNLCELTVSGCGPEVSDIFRTIHFHALKSVAVELDFPAESLVMPMDITTFLGLFYNAVSNSELQSFKLTANINILGLGPHGQSEPALRDLLAPILPIRGLRSFYLLARMKPVIARLDDADIRTLATAWPRLERLFIDRWKFTPESSVSINAIHDLYTHCADLQELSIPSLRWVAIGVHSIPPPRDCSPAHPLWHLSMSASGPDLSDEGAEAMARYLLDLFPSLDPRRKNEDDPYSFEFPRPARSIDGEWKKVARHIVFIRSARNRL